MEQLIKSLPSVLRATSDSDEVAEVACIAAWNHAVGEALRSHTKALGVEGRKLIVAVDDLIWQRQLQTMLGQLRFRINAILGQPLIAGIELRVQPEVITHKRISNHERRTGEALPKEIRDAAQKIEDQTLRQAFLGAAESCLKRLE
jgi:hypothetical protein